MIRPRSLRRDLSVGLGIGLTALWIAAMIGAYFVIRAELEEIYDSMMARTAEAVFPLAVQEAEADLRVGDQSLLTWVLRDQTGTILRRSHRASSRHFATIPPEGFSSIGNQRHLVVTSGNLSLDIASPLQERRETAVAVLSGLMLLALVLLPLSIFGVAWVVRSRLRPVAAFSQGIADRHPGDLRPLVLADLQSELVPIRDEVNRLMRALSDALDAERAFSANAAHELRTPIAAVLAHVQRLAAEVPEGPLQTRTARIEAELKRVTRLTEKLLQLARAERDTEAEEDDPTDLGAILRLVAGEFALPLTLPPAPVLSRLGPESFAILARNLIENAAVHGTGARASLTADGVLRVTNAGRVVPAEALGRLTQRFERAGARSPGSGLGLAIVAAITERADLALILSSPAPGTDQGFEARIDLPVL